LFERTTGCFNSNLAKAPCVFLWSSKAKSFDDNNRARSYDYTVKEKKKNDNDLSTENINEHDVCRRESRHEVLGIARSVELYKSRYIARTRFGCRSRALRTTWPVTYVPSRIPNGAAAGLLTIWYKPIFVFALSYSGFHLRTSEIPSGLSQSGWKHSLLMIICYYYYFGCLIVFETRVCNYQYAKTVSTILICYCCFLMFYSHWHAHSKRWHNSEANVLLASAMFLYVSVVTQRVWTVVTVSDVCVCIRVCGQRVRVTRSVHAIGRKNNLFG